MLCLVFILQLRLVFYLFCGFFASHKDKEHICLIFFWIFGNGTHSAQFLYHTRLGQVVPTFTSLQYFCFTQENHTRPLCFLSSYYLLRTEEIILITKCCFHEDFFINEHSHICTIIFESDGTCSPPYILLGPSLILGCREVPNVCGTRAGINMESTMCRILNGTSAHLHILHILFTSCLYFPDHEWDLR